MITVDVPVKVKVHKCPNCGREYWNSRNNQHLFCGSPELFCPLCGTHFIDKDLYCEWDNMTKKQKKYFIHWHGEAHRPILVGIGIFCLLLGIPMLIGFIRDPSAIVLIILGILFTIGSFILLFFGFKYFHSLKNCCKSEDVRNSILRTRGVRFEFKSKKQGHNEKKNDDLVINDDLTETIDEYISIIYKRKALFEKIINKYKNAEVTSEQFDLIQQLLLRYNDEFYKEFDYKCKSIMNDDEKYNYVFSIIEENDKFYDKINNLF